MNDKQYLGFLCVRRHDYQRTGQSLRYKASKGCVRCNLISGRVFCNDFPKSMNNPEFMAYQRQAALKAVEKAFPGRG